MVRKIILGCDNAAVSLKKTVVAALEGSGILVEDIGCFSEKDETAYPTIARAVCEKVLAKGREDVRGMLFCGTGIGMCISANKVKGIRAAVCHDCFSEERSVLSNDCNVLCMGARVIGGHLAVKLALEWIGLTFVPGPSSSKVEQIKALESDYFK